MVRNFTKLSVTLFYDPGRAMLSAVLSAFIETTLDCRRRSSSRSFSRSSSTSTEAKVLFSTNEE